MAPAHIYSKFALQFGANPYSTPTPAAAQGPKLGNRAIGQTDGSAADRTAQHTASGFTVQRRDAERSSAPIAIWMQPAAAPLAAASGLVATLYDGHSALSMTALMALCSLLALAAYLLVARPVECAAPI